jgi:hypothetical protein
MTWIRRRSVAACGYKLDNGYLEEIALFEKGRSVVGYRYVRLE